MSEERFKLCPISHCRACGYARYKLNVGLTISKNDAMESGRTRIYTGCGKAARPFDAGTNLFSPQGIPEWCPLQDEPTVVAIDMFTSLIYDAMKREAKRRGEK